MVDTGSFPGNYVNKKVARWLNEVGAKKVQNEIEIQSGIGEEKIRSYEAYVINYAFMNRITNEEEKIEIKAHSIDSPFEIIIGLQTIREHDIIDKLRGHSEVT